LNYVGRKYLCDKMLVARYLKSQILSLLALTMHLGNMESSVQKANYEFWYYESKSEEVDTFLSQCSHFRAILHLHYLQSDYSVRTILIFRNVESVIALKSGLKYWLHSVYIQILATLCLYTDIGYTVFIYRYWLHCVYIQILATLCLYTDI
jgi:hypothetical protein